MPRNTQVSDSAVNGMADLLARRLDGGFLKMFSGEQPSSADVELTDQKLLAINRFQPLSAPPAEHGVLKFHDLLPDFAVGDGEASWYRCYMSDGLTVVVDGSIAEDGNLKMDKRTIRAGGHVRVLGLSIDVRKSTAGM